MKKAGIIFFISILLLTGVLRIVSFLGPVDRNDNTRMVINIEPGSSSKEIGKKLYSNNLISSSVFFNVLVSVIGVDDDLQAGYYEFKPKDSLIKYIKDLVRGRVATFEVTIPEGYNMEEIAGRLARLTIYSKERFLNVARKEFNWSFLPEEKERLKYCLEGYLYPDTYIIPREFTPREILDVILEQFKIEWWPKLKEATENKEFTPREIITIASLIEEEAKYDKEKPLIAAVIYNRLQKNMLLQIDATIQYALPARRKRILYKDLKKESPYNTYLYQGLPPGPICNPGSRAIEAALNPANVNYLFYFALDDGNHIFTNTYVKHLKKQAEMKKRGLISE